MDNMINKITDYENDKLLQNDCGKTKKYSLNFLILKKADFKLLFLFHNVVNEVSSSCINISVKKKKTQMRFS
jgi:hypothetical protein